ncbi:MAG TPA: cupin domain-containing protein [Kaistella sp.]|jgi:Cupin domain.|uniref:cupin domain-containing protein n=1 Tax=Candidatus Kaistella beijingensis TaxID=2820270 RepID=UPI000EC32759|nr:cupin domain-containing protein [Candidatus Kaistella beijingensis]MBN8621866.1 cupin domain-containing protein [Flavobacteriales bacterium]MCA0391043.1 cupin domain-containing protein [Bacteroidota bacterium]HCN11090.1 hypothetical protein [Chryseobacterium sp.]HMU06328.1 cupin domain-containing protein [Kaistella sp.]UBB88906.1 cupin domain-containing protein [Candidatus Kaistella beijingensis]
MNILENIEFSTEKANVFHLRKNDKIKYFAVALGKDAVLKKHTTAFPATLLVLKGEIDFVFDDRQILLKQFDTFEIPVDVVHEVVGVSDENLFTVIQVL